MQSMRWWVFSESLRRSSLSLPLVEGAHCRPRRMKQKRVRRDPYSVPFPCITALLGILNGVCVCVSGCVREVGEEWALFLDSATLRLDPARCRENLVLGVSRLYGPWCHLRNYLNLAASLCCLPPILFEVVLKCLITSFKFSQVLLDFQWNVMSYFSCGIIHFWLFVGALHNTYHSLFWSCDVCPVRYLDAAERCRPTSGESWFVWLCAQSSFHRDWSSVTDLHPRPLYYLLIQ